jgi:hypothetical protein
LTKVKEKFKIEDDEKCMWKIIVKIFLQANWKKGVEEWLGSTTSL